MAENITNAGNDNGNDDEPTLPAISADLQEQAELKSKIKETIEHIEDLHEERTGISERKNALVAELEALGINRHALNAAVTYIGLPEKKRQNWDDAFAIVREALGEPMQGDLFRLTSTSEEGSKRNAA